MKRALILDIGGVIVAHDNDLLYARMTKAMTRPPTREAADAAIRRGGLGDGSGRFEAFHADCRNEFGLTADRDAFADIWCSHFAPITPVLDFLGALDPADRPVLCSNTNGTHWAFIDARWGLSRLSKKAILSFEVGAEKPQAAIYLAAAAAAGRAPAECLFVDDSQKYVDAAAALGFATYRCDDPLALIERLRREL